MDKKDTFNIPEHSGNILTSMGTYTHRKNNHEKTVAEILSHKTFNRLALYSMIIFLPSSQEGPVNPGEQSQYPVLTLHTPLTPQGGWHISTCIR